MHRLITALTMLLTIYIMFRPYPMVVEASVEVAGTVPEIELRASRKPHDDEKGSVIRKFQTTEISGNCKQVYELAKSVGATDREAEILTYIAQHESTCGTNKVSSVSYALGLYQFLPDSWGYMCRGNRGSDIDQTKCALNIIREGKTSQCNTWYLYWNGKYDGRYGEC